MSNIITPEDALLFIDAVMLATVYGHVSPGDKAAVRSAETAFKSLLVTHGFDKPNLLFRRLEAVGPGLISMSTDKDRVKDGLFRLTLKLNENEARSAFRTIITHTLRLSNPLVPTIVPCDLVTDFDGSNRLVGAHLLPILDRYDCAGSASLGPYFKQLMHVMSCGGHYGLSSLVDTTRLPADVMGHLAALQSIVAAGMHNEIDTPLHCGATQILLPDAESATGYISVTPAACGALLSALSDAISERRETIAKITKGNDALAKKHAGYVARGLAEKAAALPTPQPAPGSVVTTRQYMKAVSNMANLSKVVRSGSFILIAQPPVDVPEAREAFRMARDVHGWVASNLRWHARQRGRVARELKAFVSLFVRMEAAASTNASERFRLSRYVRFFAAVVVRRFSKLVAECGKQIGQDLPSDQQLAAAVARQLSAQVAFAAAPALLAEWEEEALGIISQQIEVDHVDNA